MQVNFSHFISRGSYLHKVYTYKNFKMETEQTN